MTASIRPRRCAALLAGSAIAVGAVACGQEAQQAPTSQAADAQSQQRGGAPNGQPPAPSGADLKAVAQELGVSTARLRAAMEAAGPASGRTSGADPLAALAEELGVSRTKLREAMSSIVPRAPPGGGNPA